MRISACFIFFTLLVLHVNSQEPKVLTYDEAINIALNESYTIKSHSTKILALKYSYQYSKSMFRPRLDLKIFAPSWNEKVDAIYQPDGLPIYNSMGSMQVGGDLSFMYVLPTGGNLALHTLMYRENLSTTLVQEDYRTLKMRQAYSQIGVSFEQPIFTKNTLKESLDESKYRYDIASSAFTREQINIIYEVTYGFFEVFRATRKLEIAETKLANSREAYRIAKLKAEAGRIPEGDLLISEVAMAQNMDRKIVQESDLGRVNDQFKQLIGINMEENIEILTEIKYDTFLVDPVLALEKALKNRLEIKEAQLNIELQHIELDRANREREISGKISGYYDITGLSTIRTGNAGDLFYSSFENAGVRPPNRGITFSVSVPIIDWGRGYNRSQQAMADLKNTELNKENQIFTIHREVKDMVRTLNEARNRLKIHEKTKVVSEKSYQISLMRFENGDITSQQLAMEQERLADSQLSYLNAFITYRLAEVNLKRATMWDFKNNRSYLSEIDLMSSY